MRKICILQNSISYGGTDTFVINLCKGLVKDGYNVTVVLSVDQNESGPRLDELQSTGVRIVWTCSPRKFKGKILHLFLLYKELKKEKYDVFQTNIDLFNGPNVFVSWLARIPIRVCHSHNTQQSRELQKGKRISIELYQRIMRWFCWNFSNRRCGCSESALDFLFGKKWKNDERARVIPNGIYLSTYKNGFNIERKKEILKLKNKYNICTIGRISYQKNPEFLFDIFYELSKLRDDVDLIWCGKGELEEVIKKKIKIFSLNDRIHLLGSRNDIPDILKCSDLFLLPSRFEGLGIVLIEAQAANLPCVVSDVIPKEVDCGMCLPISLEQMPIFWAKKISSLLDGNISLELNENKLNKYSVEYMLQMMEEVFE